PEDRYQTPEEVMEALEPWTESPIPAPPEQEMPRHTPLVARLAQANLVLPSGSTSSSSLRSSIRSEGGSPSQLSPRSASTRSTDPTLKLETRITPSPGLAPASSVGPPSTVAIYAASAVTKLGVLRDKVAPFARNRLLVRVACLLMVVV